MPDKSHFFRIYWIVINFHFWINRIFRFPICSEIRLYGITFAVNDIPHCRAIMGMLYAAKICIFFFQFHYCCILRHSAVYVSQKLCRKQKQTDSGNHNTDNEKERVTHNMTPGMLLDAITNPSSFLIYSLYIDVIIACIYNGNNNCRGIVIDKLYGSDWFMKIIMLW